MPEIRNQDHWFMDSLIASETIDISTYDKVGRIGTDGQAVICGANETPTFLFTESASSGQPVTVAYFQAVSGQAKVALSGTGSAGDKLSVGALGVLLASGTAQSAEPDEDDVGVALYDWTDGAETEVMFFKGGKV